MSYPVLFDAHSLKYKKRNNLILQKKCYNQHQVLAEL